MNKLMISFIICFFNIAFAAGMTPPSASKVYSPISGAFSFKDLSAPDQLIVRVGVDLDHFVKGAGPTLTDMNKIFVVACTAEICKPMLPVTGLGFYANSFTSKDLHIKQLTVIACDKVNCYKRVLQNIISMSSKNASK